MPEVQAAQGEQTYFIPVSYHTHTAKSLNHPCTTAVLLLKVISRRLRSEITINYRGGGVSFGIIAGSHKNGINAAFFSGPILLILLTLLGGQEQTDIHISSSKLLYCIRHS